jgi:hypothetical protein
VSRRRSVWLLTVALIALSGVLEAQTVNATISGFTTDPSGAVVPGDRITARPAGSTAPPGSYFGEYSAARDPRIIQLGVKLYF